MRAKVAAYQSNIWNTYMPPWNIKKDFSILLIERIGYVHTDYTIEKKIAKCHEKVLNIGFN